MIFNVGELIEKFKTLGYELSVNSDKIRCTPTDKSRPIPSEALPLLDLLREHKSEVIKHLQKPIMSSRIQGGVFFELTNGKRITLSDILKWPEFNRG